MKKLIILCGCFIFALSCGGNTGHDTNNASSGNADNSVAVNNSSTAPSPAASPERSDIGPGRKLENEEAVKFVTTSLPENWRLIDPDKQHPSEIRINDGKLELAIPSGKDLYGENYTAPRVLTDIKGDFQIEARVHFEPVASYQGAGLIIFFNEENYLRLERGYGGVGGGESGIRLDVKTAEEYKPLATPDDIATKAARVDLKLIRKGNKISAFWRLHEESEWRLVGDHDAKFGEVVAVGIIGVNTADRINAVFDRIKIGPVS